MSNKPSNGLKKIGRTANKFHVALYRKSGGKFAGRIANLPLMVITTYGRVTGKPTSNAVVFIQDGQDYLVSATNGGMDWTPGWYRNLKAHPQASIKVGEAVFDVRATILEGEERARRYEQFKAASANFIKYEQKASRLLPVIRLIPTSGR
jgi:deazaflavin-dependent oxidoreductase (nitroreductase family)